MPFHQHTGSYLLHPLSPGSAGRATAYAGPRNYVVDSHVIALHALQSTSLASPTPSEEGAEEAQSHVWGSSAGAMLVLTNGELHICMLGKLCHQATVHRTKHDPVYKPLSDI